LEEQPLQESRKEAYKMFQRRRKILFAKQPAALANKRLKTRSVK
jgi:hypothetical protein